LSSCIKRVRDLSVWLIDVGGLTRFRCVVYLLRMPGSPTDAIYGKSPHAAWLGRLETLTEPALGPKLLLAFLYSQRSQPPDRARGRGVCTGRPTGRLWGRTRSQGPSRIGYMHFRPSALMGSSVDGARLIAATTSHVKLPLSRRSCRYQCRRPFPRRRREWPSTCLSRGRAYRRTQCGDL